MIGSLSELEKVPLSASVLVRKDFRIRESLRKAPGGEKLKALQFLELKTEEKEKNDKNTFGRTYCIVFSLFLKKSECSNIHSL